MQNNTNPENQAEQFINRFLEHYRPGFLGGYFNILRRLMYSSPIELKKAILARSRSHPESATAKAASKMIICVAPKITILPELFNFKTLPPFQFNLTEDMSRDIAQRARVASFCRDLARWARTDRIDLVHYVLGEDSIDYEESDRSASASASSRNASQP